jgi:prepilin-type N-terminal cleavage/methylation domain-containing protein
MRFTGPRRAFTLVEMLVVIGIIVLLIGLLFPVLSRVQKAGKQTQCMNNLREIGHFYLLYAQQNEDAIPLGTSAVCDPEDNLPLFTWRTDFNDFIWVRGYPSAAMGPMLINGTFDRVTGSLLYCPDDARPEMDYPTYKKQLFPEKGQPCTARTIKIGYAVRPIPKIWVWDEWCPFPHIPHHSFKPAPYGVTTEAYPKLNEMLNKAIVAEPPERPPYNHGTKRDPLIHVLYFDGSVQLVSPKAWADIKNVGYEIVDEPPVRHVENSSAMPVWERLDQMYQAAR